MSGFQGFMGGYMWIFWIAIIVGLFLFIKWVIQQNNSKEQHLDLNPVDILKKRYARGDIDQKEYEQKMLDLLS